MSDYASLKKSTAPRTLSIVLALLIILELCSTAVLMSRVISYSPAENRRVISLTKGVGVRTGRRNADGTISWNEEGALPRTTRLLSASILPAGMRGFVMANGTIGGFSVEDDDQVWGVETDIEIFHIQYDETGDITVQTCNGDKVFAPGTGNVYTYVVKNDEKKGLAYTMYVEAFYEGTDEWIPIEAYLVDSDGKKLAGSADAYVDVLELDGIVEDNTLAAGDQRTYDLGWRWPFERTDGDGLDANDAYDTMLGDLAVDNDLTLTIRITFIAEMDEDIPPKTGDSFPYLWGGISIAAMAAIVVVLVVRKKNGKEEA